MTSTTIKVDAALRDRLRKVAQRHDRTLGQQLAVMLEEQERRDRFARVAEQMRLRPPDAAYHQDAAEWQTDRWT